MTRDELEIAVRGCVGRIGPEATADRLELALLVAVTTTASVFAEVESMRTEAKRLETAADEAMRSLDARSIVLRASLDILGSREGKLARTRVDALEIWPTLSELACKNGIDAVHRALASADCEASVGDVVETPKT